MKRRVVGVALFCFVLFAAIVAGYWDMLNTEKLRQVRETASNAVGEIEAALQSAPATVPPAAPAGADAKKVDGAKSAELQPAAPKAAEPGPAEPTIAEPTIDAPSSAAANPAAPSPAESAAESQPAPGATAASSDAGATTVAEDPDPSIAPTPGVDAATPSAVPVAPSDEHAPSAPIAEPDAAGSSPASPTPDSVATARPETAAAPTFDILRVEPDGSTVLAGRAPAGSQVSLSDGKSVLGSDTANADGAFVVVLEDKLPEGEHQIKIEAKLPEGKTVASTETAIVSIPSAGRESELLAMVEAPDQASRLITLPTPTADVPAAAQPAALDAAAPAGASGETSTASPATAPATSGEAPTGTASSTAARLAVEAVEIEDDTIYVAGRVADAKAVRVYVDDTLLSETSPTAEKRFLVTASLSLAVGDHTVRADALDAAGTVTARVEVPFFKPEGRAMSAVAPGGETPSPAPSVETPSTGTSGTDIAAATSGEPAPDLPAASSAVSNTPEGSQAVTETSPSPQTTKSDANSAASMTEAPATASSDPITATSGALVEGADASRGDRVTKGPTADNSLPAAEPSTSPAASIPPAFVPTPSLDAAISGSDTPQAVLPGPAATPADAVPVTRQAALAAVDSRVIIRKGDTLWRISRDTYGLGRRYTVIYLANGDQIRDPDRIYPGQVFRVPDEAAEPAPTAVE